MFAWNVDSVRSDVGSTDWHSVVASAHVSPGFTIHHSAGILTGELMGFSDATYPLVHLDTVIVALILVAARGHESLRGRDTPSPIVGSGGRSSQSGASRTASQGRTESDLPYAIDLPSNRTPTLRERLLAIGDGGPIPIGR